MGRRGLFITFEGPEGSGKTTQIAMLAAALASREPLVVREPGGTELGEQLRDILLEQNLEIDPETEMYLFMAARRQLIAEVIAPALSAGRIVVADRYHDSTLAYQGGGRDVPTTWPASFPRPDVTFLLALPIKSGLERHANAGKGADRVERESLEFHERVSAAYDRLAAADPERFTRLDATGSRGKVHRAVMDRLSKALGKS
jgi:dTMP kinase